MKDIKTFLIGFLTCAITMIRRQTILCVLLIFLLNSCSQLAIYSFKSSKNRMIKQIEKECKKDCKTYEKSSDEWCNCMDICLDMDEGASYCPI